MREAGVVDQPIKPQTGDSSKIQFPGFSAREVHH